MTKIAIIPDNCASRAKYMESGEIPTFYMEDFSILGFIVNNFDGACSLLRSSGFTIEDKEVGGTILIEDVSSLPTIQNILNQGGIPAEFSDIADTMYQA